MKLFARNKFLGLFIRGESFALSNIASHSIENSPRFPSFPRVDSLIIALQVPLLMGEGGRVGGGGGQVPEGEKSPVSYFVRRRLRNNQPENCEPNRSPSRSVIFPFAGFPTAFRDAYLKSEVRTKKKKEKRDPRTSV